VKPAALKTFSTLDPLVTTSLNRQSAADLAAAARRLKATLDKNKSISFNVASIDSSAYDTPAIDNTSNASGGDNNTTTTSELLKSAAATLMEGALPVRDFPSNLTSEPASISQSGNSSVVDTPKMNSTVPAAAETHEEELRCVIAIVRHGDRCVSPLMVAVLLWNIKYVFFSPPLLDCSTPKQKLKVKIREPRILEYFRKQ